MPTFPRPLVLMFVVGLLLPLAGCATEASEESGSDPHPVSIGSNERTPRNDALGVAIVVDGEGNGRVVGTLINTTDEPQTLVGADLKTEEGPARAAVVDGEVALPPGESVELAREPAVWVSADQLPIGLFVELTLEIEDAAPIEMLVPVEAQQGPYAEIEVTEEPDGDISP